jgi:DNA replication and repair protein RecF
LHLAHLHIEGLRNITAQDVLLAPGFNFFHGANGAGKTSVLEAAYLLSHARSFRNGKPEILVQNGAGRMMVAADAHIGAGEYRVGLIRDAGTWQGRVNQETTHSVAEVLRHSAMVCFDPGAHELIAGGGIDRRRLLDWGLFHVEHGFLAIASRYRRALRQRNSALKQGANDRELVAWDRELCAAAAPLASRRHAYFQRFAGHARDLMAAFLPELGDASLYLDQGWSDGSELEEQLLRNRKRDRALGHTSCGPHRANWGVRFSRTPQREYFSRGQEKVCALACLLSQAALHAEICGDWPIIGLDDLGSELDFSHQQLLMDWLGGHAQQVLISGIDVPDCLHTASSDTRVFHVEHGRIRALI